MNLTLYCELLYQLITKYSCKTVRTVIALCICQWTVGYLKVMTVCKFSRSSNQTWLWISLLLLSDARQQNRSSLSLLFLRHLSSECATCYFISWLSQYRSCLLISSLHTQFIGVLACIRLHKHSKGNRATITVQFTLTNWKGKSPFWEAYRQFHSGSRSPTPFTKSEISL